MLRWRVVDQEEPRDGPHEPHDPRDVEDALPAAVRDEVSADRHGERRPQRAGHHVGDEFGALEGRNPLGGHRGDGGPGGAEEEAHDAAQGDQGDDVDAAGGGGEQGE